MSAVLSALPSSTTMISKSGVSSEAALTVRITMLAMVPLSLYAGKKTLRPAGFAAGDADMQESPNHSTKGLNAPLHVGDGHFRDPALLAGGDEQHLDEKRIAVGDEPVERQRGQGLAAPAAIAAGAVARVDARDGAHVQVREATQQTPACRPVDDRAARDVPRSD